MTDQANNRILLPAGMLPPGEWAVGARVRLRGASYVLVRRMDGGKLWLSAPGEGGACSAMDAQVAVRLDITTGPLDYATRALWHALGLGDQPLCAPRWFANSRGVYEDGCLLRTVDRWCLNGGKAGSLTWFSAEAEGAELPVPGIGDDPRRALQPACGAVWAKRGR